MITTMYDRHPELFTPQTVFVVSYQDLFDLLACRQRAELADDCNWLGLLEAVTHPETVEGYEPDTLAECVALAYGTHPLDTYEVSKRWSGTSASYKASQPYRNDLYPY